MIEDEEMVCLRAEILHDLTTDLPGQLPALEAVVASLRTVSREDRLGASIGLEKMADFIQRHGIDAGAYVNPDQAALWQRLVAELRSLVRRIRPDPSEDC